MSYQILALDLDGTLTTSDKKITPQTVNAILQIQERGKKIILASGRPAQGVLPLAKQLQLSRFGGYILCFNGGKIIDCRTKKAVYNKLLPETTAAPLYEIAKQYPVDILAYSQENLISGICPNRYSKLESRINNMPIVRVDQFPDYVDSQNNKFLITGEPEYIALVEEAVKKHFRGSLNIYCSEPFFLEIMPQKIDKAYSLQKLLNSIGLTANDMICCGDGYNDLSMIEYAGLGVAMENAQPIVRERADYITKSNDEDGVLHVIRQFLMD